jgi:hypothetical protein
MQRNLIHEIIEDGYRLITKKHMRWPKELDDNDRLIILDELTEYYENLEEYEKCKVLSDKIKKIELKLEKEL